LRGLVCGSLGCWSGSSCHAFDGFLDWRAFFTFLAWGSVAQLRMIGCSQIRRRLYHFIENCCFWMLPDSFRLRNLGLFTPVIGDRLFFIDRCRPVQSEIKILKTRPSCQRFTKLMHISN
jgi:hypothetical protein